METTTDKTQRIIEQWQATVKRMVGNLQKHGKVSSAKVSHDDYKLHITTIDIRGERFITLRLCKGSKTLDLIRFDVEQLTCDQSINLVLRGVTLQLTQKLICGLGEF